MYSGNEAATYTVTLMLGTSLLTVGSMERRHDMVSFIAPLPQLQEGYEGGTVDTRASKDCTIEEPDFIASYQGEAEV